MAAAQECHICLDELRHDLATAPCGHVFHHVCILQAVHVNPQCPICRRRTDDSDLITLYLDVPSGSEAAAPAAGDGHALGTQSTAATSGDATALSARVDTLMERMQWQATQQDRLVHELRRLQSQSEHLVAEKQTLAERVEGLQDAKTQLLIQVARYQMELSRQTEAARRACVNQSILRYLETCDAAALEDEVPNPRELIVALKKACKFRHDQYQKVVKEKMRLKEMLHNSAQAYSGQPQLRLAGADRPSKTKGRGATRALETKRAYVTPAGLGTGLLQPPVVTNKKRKIDSSSPLLASVNPVPFMDQQRTDDDDGLGWHPRLDSTGAAYSDVPIRPPPHSRPFVGRGHFYSSQYGPIGSTTPPGRPFVQQPTGAPAAVCRRGYDETGKLTNFFCPNGDAEVRFASRDKTLLSMQNLLDAQSGTAGQQPRMASNDRQEYALTNWLRHN